MKIAVLLASYNGEKYIKEQIDSLLWQTCQDFTLYIRDDGSSDKTYSIEKEYERRHPEKVHVFQNIRSEHDVKCNFWELCKIGIQTDASYFMFCDQDDVWNLDKIQRTLVAMQDAEQQTHGQPTLVHTDLTVVDQNLTVLGESFIQHRALNPECKSLNRLLVQNNVTGCTTMVNRALLEKAMELVDINSIVMHDWWLALVASLFGNIIFLSTPTIQYRQHSGNVVGATKVNSLKFVQKRLSEISSVRKKLYQSAVQAASLLNTYERELPDADKVILEVLATIGERKKVEKIFLLLKYNLLKQGLIQVIGQLVLM